MKSNKRKQELKKYGEEFHNEQWKKIFMTNRITVWTHTEQKESQQIKYEEEKSNNYINWEKWMRKQQKLDIGKRSKIASTEKSDARREESPKGTKSQLILLLKMYHKLWYHDSKYQI